MFPIGFLLYAQSLETTSLNTLLEVCISRMLMISASYIIRTLDLFMEEETVAADEM